MAKYLRRESLYELNYQNNLIVKVENLTRVGCFMNNL